MTEYKLKYGCNPNQNPARIHMDGQALPFQILNGAAGYINLLDAFNSWQLVRELKAATGLPSAASFKHVSPAGAAVAKPLTAADRQVCFVPEGLEPHCPGVCARPRLRSGVLLWRLRRP